MSPTGRKRKSKSAVSSPREKPVRPEAAMYVYTADCERRSTSTTMLLRTVVVHTWVQGSDVSKSFNGARSRSNLLAV